MSRYFRMTWSAMIASCLLIACTTITAWAAENNPVTWWVLSDSHVDHIAYDGNLGRAVADVNALGITHYAIVLGDCVDERGEPYRQGYPDTTPQQRWVKFVGKMNQLKHEWTYVLGNHDNTGRAIPVNSVTDPNWFSKTVNGVRIIGLSDEHLSEDYVRDLEMSDEQREWFLAEMASDPHIPTIIMSHQHRTNSFPFIKEWVDNHIDEYNVILFVGGHSHEWALRRNVDNQGFHEVVLNPILRANESSFMTITNRDDVIEISFRFRNHTDRKWIAVDGQEVFAFQVPVPVAQN